MKSYSPSEILSLAWNLKVPVDLNLIAGRMGIQVSMKRLSNASAEVILRGSRLTVHLNEDESVIARRYALAHALGYIFSGQVGDADSCRTFSSSDYRYPSAQGNNDVANRFALALLMPRDAVDICIAQASRSVGEIAELFLTSEAAVHLRLEIIGALPPSRRRI